MAGSPRDVILHRRSQVFNKRPLSTDIQAGEIAVNYDEDDISLYIRDNQNDIRKVGGVFYSADPPNPSVAIDGWPDLSHGELWLKKQDPLDPEGKVQLWVWNKYTNGGAGDWIHIGAGTYAILDDYLDQFKDGADGEDYIHTERNRLKINDKTALRGYATTIPSDDETDVSKANTLVINDEHNFATGVLLNANNLVIDSSDIDVTSDVVTFSSESAISFQTDSVTGATESTFTYNDHGFFNGEEIFVDQYLNDGTTPGGVASGNYTVAEATLHTFKLYDGSSNVLATGNVKISYSPKLILDQNYNVIQSGNFKVKELADTPDTSQIAEGRWDIYQNTLNGNVRVYSRTNGVVSEVGTSSVTINVKNSGGGAIPALTPVYFVGFDPIKKMATVGIADAGANSRMNAIGVTNAEIPANGYGVATIYGEMVGVDTTGITGEIGGADDSGRILYVANGGGLTFTPPSVVDGIRQPVAILFNEDGASGRLFVNHPDVNDVAQLQDGYMWIGVTGDNAVAHRINTYNFSTFVAQDGEYEINLSDEIKFGAYDFLWDGNSASKTQTKVSTSDQPAGTSFSTSTVIDSFSTTYRSAKFFVQLSLGGPGFTPNYQITELLVVHNGTDVDLVDYGTASTLNARMGDFSAGINGSDVEIYFSRYEATKGEIEIKAVRTAVLS